MSEIYRQLLEATIQYVEGLQARGVHYLPVSVSTMAGLAMPPIAPARSTGVSRPVTASSRPTSTPAAVAARPPRQPTAPQQAAPVQPTMYNPTTKVSPSVEKPQAPLPTPPMALKSPSPLQIPTTASTRPQIPVQPLSPANKEALMAELRQTALACQKCPHLVKSRRNVVFGVGSVNSPLLFIGEAPGMDEDAQGEPFVGKAGQLLTKIIQAMGLSRERVYIANILKCRPDTPGQSSGNRPPTPEEMKECMPYLLAQIDIIQPKVIVALGATAVNGLLGSTVGITKLRGNFQTFHQVPLMPTFHPSYVIRYGNLQTKRLVWEDMLQVMEKLGMPISEKQRSYFLTAIGAQQPGG